MKLYSCKVRLYGEVKDEVQKPEVTAAEVRVLRNVHGGDAVVDVKENGACDRSEDQERDRLSQLYGEKTIARMFGVPIAKISSELPTEMDAAVAALPVVDHPPKRGPGRPRRDVPDGAADAVLE